ncbi:MAG: FecR family protein [Pseudomonadota bacterium]
MEAFARRLVLLSLILVAGAFAQPTPGNAQTADDRIGLVKSTNGAVWVNRADARIEAKPGDPLFRSDNVEVGDDGGASVVLLDGTSLSIGAGSIVWLDEFDYQPQNDALALVVRILRGSMLFVTGEIGKLAPANIRIETPTGTLGVRGTRFIVRTAQ